MTHTEGNAIIAKFMGLSVYPEQGTPEYNKWKGKACDYSAHQLKYHESWDWLMPVVEKIEATLAKGTIWTSIDENAEVEWSFTVSIEGQQCMIARDCSPQYYGTETDFLELYDCRNWELGLTKIQVTYAAVLQFINEENK